MKQISIFLCLLLLSALPQLVHAVEEALVRSEKAIVYAESDLLTPIGYLKRGKKIYVGSNPLRKGLIYSIILPGKIAYVQSKDLQLENHAAEDKKLTEHNLETIEGVEEEIFSINNHLTLQMAQLDMGEDWKTIREEMGDTSGDNTMSYWRFLFEHRDPRFALNCSFGMDFMSKEVESLKFSAWGLEGNLHYSFIKTSYFSADLFAGLLGFPYVRTENSLALDQEQYGKMWGGQYGLQARIFPYSDWGAVLGFMYTTLTVDIKDVVTQQESDIITDPVYSKPLSRIAGWNLFFGISYKF